MIFSSKSAVSNQYSEDPNPRCSTAIYRTVFEINFTVHRFQLKSSIRNGQTQRKKVRINTVLAAIAV